MKALEALRAFIECGSVSKAADRLGRTQPQVGRLLAGLEASVGVALFNRENRRLSLTADGVRFYQQAERVLVANDGLRGLAGDMRHRRPPTHLRVLTAPQIASALLGDALIAMTRLVPGFSARIESRVRLDFEASIGTEEFDIGIAVPPLDHPGVRTEPLCNTPAVAVMPHAHPLAKRPVIRASDLAEHDLVVTHPRSLLRQQLEHLFREANLQPRIRIEATNGAIACQMAAAGLGVALANPFVARSSASAGTVIRPFTPSLMQPHALFYPTWQAPSDLVKQFAALIIGSVRERDVDAMDA